MIVTEDKKFYSHNGIDAQGILRAVLALIRNNGEKTQGASTITQQLARSTFLSTEKTYQRKIEEIFIALELENKYTKDQILEFYLNTIYYANGYYGIEAAARGYFSKGCDELTLGEICFLSAIPNNPTTYDPLENYDNTVDRKNRILDQMLDDGVITDSEYETAYNEEIELNIQEVKKRDYIQTFVSYCAIRELMKVNGFEFQNSFSDDTEEEEYDEEYDEAYSTAQQMLLNGGYQIYTSIDLKKQKQLQKAVNTNLSSFTDTETDGTYKMQGSATCIDNETGRVVAIVGGRSQDTDGYSLNRAFQSFRQPGSSIKPLIVYTPTLERGATASTTVHDYQFTDGPSNSSGRYYGYVSLRFAVEQSLNTVAWQLFEELTPKVGLQYLLDMNFSKIDDSDYTLSASLGGLTYGTSTLEMASAYATLANDGDYREPTCIVKILDADGNEVVADQTEETSVYKKDASRAMTDILTGVITSGTASGLGLDNGQPSAGKTGTTNDKKDGWFCGYTPYYTTAVWVGYDTPQEVSDLYGSSYPGNIWHDFMSTIHESLEIKQFDLDGISTSSTYSSSYSSQESDTGDADASSEEETDSAEEGSTDVDEVDEADPTEVPATEVPTVTEVPATEVPVETEVPSTDTTEEGTDTQAME